MFQNLETIDELAARWKVKQTWIYAKTKETGPGSIPRLKMGKYLRFQPEEVDDWLRKKQQR